MGSYRVRAYDEHGAFVFGATLNCGSDDAAVIKFRTLPLGSYSAELLRGARILARHAAPVALSPLPASRFDDRAAATPRLLAARAP